ncbi:hypothetical protein ACFWAN_03900 [Streptomyces mirabilis]|uniref:hypothetical protein n=1 Tax=Streptomyces mirabilis TaxID=68239 RepID=UPI00364FE731
MADAVRALRPGGTAVVDLVDRDLPRNEDIRAALLDTRRYLATKTTATKVIGLGQGPSARSNSTSC